MRAGAWKDVYQPWMARTVSNAEHLPPLMAELLQQQFFDVAMDQHGDIGLDPRRPFKFGVFARIECLDEFARHLCFARQQFDFGIGIGRPNEFLHAHHQGFVVHGANYTNDATSWLFCSLNLPSRVYRGPKWPQPQPKSANSSGCATSRRPAGLHCGRLLLTLSYGFVGVRGIRQVRLRDQARVGGL
jgi:hypothetical protein